MNDWYFLVLLAILGYFEGALRRESSSGSRGGGSRLCKQDVGCKIGHRGLSEVSLCLYCLIACDDSNPLQMLSECNSEKVVKIGPRLRNLL